jgi:hypothetical protein
MTCKGVNIRGKPCMRAVKTGDYCPYHQGGTTKYKEPKKKKEPQPETKKKSEEVDLDEECCVCYDPTKEILTCNHRLCSTCITKMSQNDCPLCRRKLKGKHVRSAIAKRGQETEEVPIPPPQIQNPPRQISSLPQIVQRLINPRFDDVFSDLILGMSPQELAFNLSDSSYNRIRNSNIIPV